MQITFGFLSQRNKLYHYKTHMFKTWSFHGENICFTVALGCAWWRLICTCAHRNLVCVSCLPFKEGHGFNICSRTGPEGGGRSLHISPQLLNPTFVSIPPCLGLLLSDSPTAAAADALGFLCITTSLNCQWIDFLRSYVSAVLWHLKQVACWNVASSTLSWDTFWEADRWIICSFCSIAKGISNLLFKYGHQGYITFLISLYHW